MSVALMVRNLLVRRFSQGETVALFDPVGLTLGEESRPRPTSECDGFYDLVDGELVCLFRDRGDAKLLVGSSVYFDLEKVFACYRGTATTSTIQLYANGRIEHALTSQLSPEESLGERNDFLLFLFNALSDRQCLTQSLGCEARKCS